MHRVYLVTGYRADLASLSETMRYEAADAIANGLDDDLARRDIVGLMETWSDFGEIAIDMQPYGILVLWAVYEGDEAIALHVQHS